MRKAAAVHGSPTMVRASTQPPTSQAIPAANPPKMNHRIFSSKVMRAVSPRHQRRAFGPTRAPKNAQAVTPSVYQVATKAAEDSSQ